MEENTYSTRESSLLRITRGEEFLTWSMERLLQAFLKELELRENHFKAMTSWKPLHHNRLDGEGSQEKGATANALFTKFCLGKHAHENCQRVEDPKECKGIVLKFARCCKCMNKGHGA